MRDERAAASSTGSLMLVCGVANARHPNAWTTHCSTFLGKLGYELGYRSNRAGFSHRISAIARRVYPPNLRALPSARLDQHRTIEPRTFAPRPTEGPSGWPGQTPGTPSIGGRKTLSCPRNSLSNFRQCYSNAHSYRSPLSRPQ